MQEKPRHFSAGNWENFFQGCLSVIKSTLLKRYLTLSVGNEVVFSSARDSVGFEESINQKIRSASSITCLLRRIPSTSTTFSLSRKPAVSKNRTLTPLSRISPSTTSRVVPACDVTIALWVPKRVFNKLDFPTLGGPIKATVK